MSRRFQEMEERGRRDIEAAKVLLKRLGDRERAHLLGWLCLYCADDGALAGSGAKARMRIVLDGIEYWIVRVPKRR
jgi:hypothetical protein